MLICFYCVSQDVSSPVEEYFNEKFKNGINNNELINIVSKWIYVAENNGLPDGQYAKKKAKYDFVEIHIKRSQLLIRFPYYRDCQNSRLVLLLGYEKKDGYKGGDKTDRFVKKSGMRLKNIMIIII